MNKTVRTLFAVVTAATLTIVPAASAQTWNHTANNSAANVYVAQNAAATVTFYDNNPMSSRRILRTARVALPSDAKAQRRALRAVAPRNAQWAQVRMANGQRFMVNLHPVRHLRDNRHN